MDKFPIGQASAQQADAELSRLFHDLNQPLSAINSYAQAGAHLADSGMHDAARLKELFGKIAAQSVRASDLARELRAAVGAFEQPR